MGEIESVESLRITGCNCIGQKGGTCGQHRFSAFIHPITPRENFHLSRLGANGERSVAVAVKLVLEPINFFTLLSESIRMMDKELPLQLGLGFDICVVV